MNLLESILKYPDIKGYLSQYDSSEWEKTIISVLQYGIHSLKGLKHFKSRQEISKPNGKEKVGTNSRAISRDSTPAARHQRPRTSAKNYPCKEKYSNLPRKCHGKENFTPGRSKFHKEIDRSLVVATEESKNKSSQNFNNKSLLDVNDKSSRDFNTKPFLDLNDKSAEDLNDKSYQDLNNKSAQDLNDKSVHDFNERSYIDLKNKAYKDFDDSTVQDPNNKSTRARNDAFRDVPRILQPVELPLNNLSSLL